MVSARHRFPYDATSGRETALKRGQTELKSRHFFDVGFEAGEEALEAGGGDESAAELDEGLAGGGFEAVGAGVAGQAGDAADGGEVDLGSFCGIGEGE